MITKEIHHRATHAEQTEKCCADKCTDKCKGSKCGLCAICVFACIFALVAAIFSILAFVTAKKSTPANLWPLQENVQKMYEFTVNQNGGEESFLKLNQFYASDAIKDNIASQIDAMIDQQAGGDNYVPTNTESPSSNLDQAAIQAVLGDAHYFGNMNAKIVILEYSDLLCPFCQRHYNDQTIETVVANHPDEVALVFKNFPLPSLHPTAPLGAKGLYCAGKLGGDEAYYNFLPKAVAAYDFTDTSVVEIAKTIGLNEAAFTDCYQSAEASSAVDASINEGSALFGINGTPGNVVLNRETGEFIVISGAYPVSEFENAVSQLL